MEIGTDNEETLIEVKGRKARAEKMVRFSELEKKEKIKRAVIYSFAVLVIAATLSYVLWMGITRRDPYNRFMSAIGSTVLFAAPLLIQPIFKYRFSIFVLYFFYIYTFFAVFLGTVCNFYNFFADYGYDKVLHVVLGYVGGVLGLLILCKRNAFDKNSGLIIGLFCTGIAMTWGGFWEVFEFACDVFWGQNAQGIPVLTEAGEWVIPVTDTSLDLLCNLSGSVIFLIHFAIHRLTKKNLVMGSIIKGCKS